MQDCRQVIVWLPKLEALFFHNHGMCTLKSVREKAFAMHQFSSLHHNLASPVSAERREGGGDGGWGSQADRNSKRNFAQETYGTNLQVGLGHCCHVSHTSISERRRRKTPQKPHNRFGLFKRSHPDKHLEGKYLNKHEVNLT